MFVDTHAHLNFDTDYPDLDDVIKNAKKADVGIIINVGAEIASSEKAIELASKYENLYATVGLHPSDHEPTPGDLDKLKSLVRKDKVVAIGEAGLDYYRLEDESKKDYQKKLFLEQIKLAHEVNLPLIIHTRDVDEDMYNILAVEKIEKGVVHCFTSNWQFAKKILDLGLMISFTGIIVFDKSGKLDEVVKNTPLERMMIETDCPWLAPPPYRGKRNEPAYVVEVAKKIAEIKNISLEEVEKVTTENAKKFFTL